MKLGMSYSQAQGGSPGLEQGGERGLIAGDGLLWGWSPEMESL